MINLTELYQTFFNLIYPCYCNFCKNKILDGDIYFCNNCYATIEYLDITKKLKRDLRCEDFYSLFHFDPNSVSQTIIHLIKYGNKPALGVKMGKELGEKLRHHKITADFIIPLPLHVSRQRERGYNQAEVITKGLSQILNIPIRTDIIKRDKYTESQTKLSKEKREKNVRDAFVITECDLTGKEIFILDDVITSGATINACIELLEKRGAKKITALSLALVRNIYNISTLDT
jgi:ComF family protein